MYQNQIKLENRMDHMIDLEQQIKENQNHLDMLAVENERLNKILIEKMEVIENINREKNEYKQ